MNNISEKIVQLRLATRRACMCENTAGGVKNTITLKSKMLFLLRDSSASPAELMSALGMGKTNLAILARDMITENLIERKVDAVDRRHIEYIITDKGKEHIQVRLQAIEKGFKNVLTTTEEYNKATSDIDKILELLSFL